MDLYDTTLRDGTQQEGISLSVQDKISITEKLDDIGIPFIEGTYLIFHLSSDKKPHEENVNFSLFF